MTTHAVVASPPDWPRLMKALLVSSGVLLWSVFLRLRRIRHWHPTTRLRPYEWHCCGVAGCRTHVRPREIMCIEHWCQVPVPTRMALAKLIRPGIEQSREWQDSACNAIDFVSRMETP